MAYCNLNVPPCGYPPSWAVTYIENIEGKLNANDNIRNLCFHKEGILFNEFELIFHDLFGKKGDIYKKIIELLSGGQLEFNEICKKLNYHKSGVMSEYLENLRISSFVSRNFTWLIASGKESRLSQFRLSDNYLRFYMKYLLHNKNKILEDTFQEINMSSLPQWDTIMGLSLENLILKNRKSVLHKLGIRVEDIVADNPFLQRKTLKNAGCQIDYLVQTRFNSLFACEIKFSRSPIKLDVITEVQEKISRLTVPRGFSCCPVLIHAGEIDGSVRDNGYFTEIIDFGDLLV